MHENLWQLQATLSGYILLEDFDSIEKMIYMGKDQSQQDLENAAVQKAQQTKVSEQVEEKMTSIFVFAAQKSQLILLTH
jgi:hypothetical protein